jgi:short chain dehydrogenase
LGGAPSVTTQETLVFLFLARNRIPREQTDLHGTSLYHEDRGLLSNVSWLMLAVLKWVDRKLPTRLTAWEVSSVNAGVFNPKPFLELTEKDYDWYLDTILKGKFFAAQAAAKAMKEHGGAIVQTGSMWAIQAIGCDSLGCLLRGQRRGTRYGAEPCD